MHNTISECDMSCFILCVRRFYEQIRSRSQQSVKFRFANSTHDFVEVDLSSTLVAPSTFLLLSFFLLPPAQQSASVCT
jgi:hypothetical protein